MDGWGISNETEHNAVAMASTPVFDELIRRYPNGIMHASGEHVGLPSGQMGNSEVGHVNLGAGRIVMQNLPRINEVIENNLLKDNTVLSDFIISAQNSNSRCHLIGLLSNGGVHSHQSHIEALANLIGEAGIEVFFHAILDGRDTSPKSAKLFVQQFMEKTHPNVSIVSLMGRFYAMDRDNRWERVEKAFKAIVFGEGKPTFDLMTEIDNQYNESITDEFLYPTIVTSYKGIQNGDALLFGNFRADRAREILSAIVEPTFSFFKRPTIPTFSVKAGLVSYSDAIDQHLKVLFPSDDLEETIGETISRYGLKQLRIAETEKYPHVTFFLNGGRELKFEGEERILIPSPKVTTYDLQPEMSAKELTDRLLDVIRKDKFDFIVVNFANPDMVGHTGNLGAAIKAVETVDYCIGRVVKELKKVGGTMFLTADHGNCEKMLDSDTGTPHTAHTTNFVPTVLVNAPPNVTALTTGRLADVAPTLLELMEIPIPAAMNGTSMLSTLKN
jgi:2,3-bisphosphoglycerate-independent phosphoglycerate mutase